MSQPTNSMREFHAKAYEELRMKNPDRGLWATALAESEGNQKRAISYYVRERARELHAHADAATPKPVNVWDGRQAPNLPAIPAANSSSRLWLPVLGLGLLAYVLTGAVDQAVAAMLLGAGPGLVAIGINELNVRLGGASSLPRMRLFCAVSVGFAYPILLGTFAII